MFSRQALHVTIVIGLRTERVPATPRGSPQWGYDLAYRIGNRDHPKVRAFRSWIADEVREFPPEECRIENRGQTADCSA